jgi:hypothetical protein
MFVLFEDLRIESLAIEEESMPSLDILDPAAERDPNTVGAYRRHYFLLRSIGTIWEFAESLQILSGGDLLKAGEDFRDVTRTFGKAELEKWSRASLFFKNKEPRIKMIRNDIGGHFGSQAATYAVKRLKPDASLRIEICDLGDRGKTDVRLHLAGELVATAFYRHVANEDIVGFGNLLDEIVKPSFIHANVCVRILAWRYVWPLLG